MSFVKTCGGYFTKIIPYSIILILIAFLGSGVIRLATTLNFPHLFLIFDGIYSIVALAMLAHLIYLLDKEFEETGNLRWLFFGITSLIMGIIMILCFAVFYQQTIPDSNILNMDARNLNNTFYLSASAFITSQYGEFQPTGDFRYVFLLESLIGQISFGILLVEGLNMFRK